VLSNMPVVIEQNVEWITGVIQYMRAHDLDGAGTGHLLKSW